MGAHNIRASNRSLGPACQPGDPKLTPHRSPHQGVPMEASKASTGGMPDGRPSSALPAPFLPSSPSK
eukprot:scaffold56191_cov57-Phaeocystis_antarctica.AAC.1